MFSSKAKTVSVRVDDRTKVYDVRPGKKLDWNLMVQGERTNDKDFFEFAPGVARARVTIRVEYFVEGELE